MLPSSAAVRRLVLAAATAVLLAGCSEPADRGTDPAPGAATALPSPEVRLGLVLATQAGSDGLVFVDPARRADAVVGRVVVGDAPWDIGLGPDGETAYVSTAQGLAVVDLTSRRRTALIEYRNQPAAVEYGEFRPGGMGLTVSPDGGRVYVGVYREDGTSVLEVIDVEGRTVVGAVEVGLRPFDVLRSADGREVYTVDHDSFTVHVVDTDSLRARRIEVAPFGTRGGLSSWEKPHYAVLAPTGELLLPYQGRTLVRLDPVTGAITREPMSANSHQHGAVLAGDGRLLVVGTGPAGNATGGPNLTVRALADERDRVIALNRRHETVTAWRSPRGELVAVLAGGYTRPGGWDGLTLVELNTGAIRHLRVPGYPQTVLALPAT